MKVSRYVNMRFSFKKVCYLLVLFCIFLTVFINQQVLVERTGLTRKVVIDFDVHDRQARDAVYDFLNSTNHISSCQNCPQGYCSSQERPLTGNPLIDCYGQGSLAVQGELGQGMRFYDQEKNKLTRMLDKYGMNVRAGDMFPLNRRVPDSRPAGCQRKFSPEFVRSLPSLAVIIPFHNEWPSILLRTIYSLINRTPSTVLRKIILIDDASTIEGLGHPLQDYIDKMFPADLIRLVRLQKRHGLIRARIVGTDLAKTDVISFQDAHIEVGMNWAEPLLAEIKKDRRTVAQSQLDRIQLDTLEYTYFTAYRMRYIFHWNLEFFQDFYRPDQLLNIGDHVPLDNPILVGSAFAVDRKYFQDIGSYDPGMNIWGGENLELSWRIWMCGGRIVQFTCSRIGHIKRHQPYAFPEGKARTLLMNYRRAIDVWMGPWKKYSYAALQGIQTVPGGNLTERLKIKESLKCRDFSWYVDNVLPELNLLERNAAHWGTVKNEGTGQCLDTKLLFQYTRPLYVTTCERSNINQWFSMKKTGLFTSSLHCVSSFSAASGSQVQITSCITNNKTLLKWTYEEKTGWLREVSSGNCLTAEGEQVHLARCGPENMLQRWLFTPLPS